ncbi:hypothetical protein BDZ91DRAFT_709090 [Kalaharituber pfeilii]|nr:hypothetical protein BDZ91DRAFT_709090 [Kalaharituber pfeilii]
MRPLKIWVKQCGRHAFNPPISGHFGSRLRPEAENNSLGTRTGCWISLVMLTRCYDRVPEGQNPTS